MIKCQHKIKQERVFYYDEEQKPTFYLDEKNITQDCEGNLQKISKMPINN